MLALDLVEQFRSLLIIALVHRALGCGVERVDVAGDVGGVGLGAVTGAAGGGKDRGTGSEQD
jgi:hypothetical protein